jgi:DNA primase
LIDLSEHEVKRVDKGFVVKEIKARILISSVIGPAVELKGRSPNFLGRCPFHQEKTPSFHVRDNHGRFKCFGCGASGDVFEFLMKLRGITFVEAIAELSIKAGLQPPTHATAQLRPPADKDVLFAQRAAQEYFVKQLFASPTALHYLREQRGLSERMIRQAGLGFGGMSKEHFVSFLESKSIREKRALEAGLLKDGRFSTVPPFLSRITFPIRDTEGSIVAFGGRAFLERDNDAPKYVNTHSYQHYEKRKSFYGWFESKPAMQKGLTPILVEGYFDAMALWALGKPALALCGTALTTEHIERLRSMSSRLILCFDSDRAGVSALRAALVLLYRMNIEPRLLLLDEKDPGDYLVKRDLDGLQKRAESLSDALCFLIDDAAITAAEGVNERVQQIDLLLPIFASIKRPLVRRQYVAYLAQRLHEEPALLWAEIERRVKAEPKISRDDLPRASARAKPLSTNERLVLLIAMSAPSLIEHMTPVFEVVQESLQQVIAAVATNYDVNADDKIEDVVEKIVKNIEPSLWPSLVDVVQHRIIFSEEEARASLEALERKIVVQKNKATLKKKTS